MFHTLRLFAPHPNLSDTVNRRIIQSEIEGGVFLADLPPASVLEIQTQHHDYRAVTLSENSVLISGHPEYCPKPVLVAIAGSTWGGSMLKRGFVGRGMRLEFSHPVYRALSPPRVSRRFASVPSSRLLFAYPAQKALALWVLSQELNNSDLKCEQQ